MAEARMRTPLGRVLHFGPAHEGTTHFWRQRVTAAANVPLIIGFIVLLATTVGRPYGEAVAILGSPLVALLLVLMTISVAIHMRIGMQTIVEDYVHGEALKVVTLIASTFFTAAVAVVSLFAILKLAFGT
jgi:succinate dehydrogenase / fumarate reductase membrane anchor subunit